MKYQSELIKEIVDTRGHKKSSLHYESECIETWIEEAKGAYPKLCDYEGEWLYYIYNNEGTGGGGDFPYETFTGTQGTIENVVPLAYKSAILKGSTKYRDIDTGEVLDAFEEGRNLELVSVNMPVLTTTGKNLLSSPFQLGWINTSNGSITSSTNRIATTGLIKVLPSTRYAIARGSGSRAITAEFDEGENYLGMVGGDVFTTKSNTTKIRIFIDATTELIGHSLTIGENNKVTYEPYKSNILTVNEDVTLRSNGSVCDELDLLTGKLTQRIDEDGEILAQEVVKTVGLTVVNQNGETLSKIKPIEGTMHIETSGTTIPPIFECEVPVEAITQNLESFIEGE